jgi:hypothetical protein
MILVIQNMNHIITITNIIRYIHIMYYFQIKYYNGFCTHVKYSLYYYKNNMN